MIAEEREIYGPDPGQPKLRIMCSCGRNWIQEQIFTCFGCTQYFCMDCTLKETIAYQCHNCLTVSDLGGRHGCRECFSCPVCGSVLLVDHDKNKVQFVNRDGKTTKHKQVKKYYMYCQFCPFTTKEINVVGKQEDILTSQLNCLSANIDKKKLAQKKYYTYSHSEDILYNKKQEQFVPHMDDDEDDEQKKIPQNLRLTPKRIRRCPACRKPVSTTFRNKGGEQKLELLYKEMRILQCQRLQPLDGKAYVKCLRDMKINEENCKKNDLKEVEVNTPFTVKVEIKNIEDDSTCKAAYKYIIEAS